MSSRLPATPPPPSPPLHIKCRSRSKRCVLLSPDPVSHETSTCVTNGSTASSSTSPSRPPLGHVGWLWNCKMCPNSIWPLFDASSCPSSLPLGDLPLMGKVPPKKRDLEIIQSGVTLGHQVPGMCCLASQLLPPLPLPLLSSILYNIGSDTNKCCKS